MEKIKINKIGAGHLEMVIAFTLFFLFVVFLLIYIRPYNNKGLEESIFLGIRDSFVEDVQTNFTKIFLKAESIEGGCFAVDLSRFPIEGNSIAIKGLESNINSGLNGNILSVDATDDNFYILLSKDFDDDEFVCMEEGAAALISFGSVENRKIISEKSLLTFKKRYEEDYESLKKELGVPVSIDFSINAEDFILEKNVPMDVAVFARAYVEEVLKTNGTIINKEFILKLW